ncbi:MAG: carboxymuconolactone decarboxylase family protein [Pseudomonadales bacterium]|nr:carboxymuconolactone decarboxylase family protein [Pseudomonadales bacterium]
MDSFTKYTPDNSPQASADTLAAVKTQFGFVPNLMAYMAQSPVLLKAYKALGDLFAESSLTATEQQLVLMTINRFHECRYCMSGHTKVAEMSGVDMQVINAIRDDQPIGDSKLGALRGFTLNLVAQRGKVSQAQVNALLAQGYSQEVILEIVAAAAYKTMSNYTNHIVGTELDAAFIDKRWQPINER